MTSMDNSPQRPVWPIRIRSWINQLFINRYSSWDDRIVAQQIKVALESWNGAVYGWDIARDDSREECLRYVVDSLSQDIIIFGVVLAYRLRDSPHAQQYSRLILMVGSILTSYWGPECALVGPDTIPPSVDDFSGGFMVWTNVLADFVLSSPTPPAQHTSQHPSYPHTGEDTGHNFFVSSQAHHTPANRNTTNSSLAAPATVNGGALNTTHPQNTSYPYQTPPYPAPNTSYPTPPYNYPSQYSSYPTPPYPVQNTSYSYPTPPYPPSHAPHLPQTPPRPPENAPQPPQTVPPPTQTAPPPPQNISYPTPPYLPQNTSWPFQTPPYPPPNVPYPTPPYPPQNTSWPVQTPQYPPPNVLQPPLNVPQQPQTAPPPHQAAPPSQPDSAPSIQTPHHRPVTPYPSAPAQVDSDAANNEAAVDVDVDLEITEEEVFIPVIPGVAGLGNEPVRTGGSAAAGAGAGGLVSRGGGGEVGDSSGGAVNAGGGEAGNDDDANNGPRPPRLQWHPFLAPPMYPIPYDQPHPHGVLIPNIPMTLNPDPRLPPGPTLESGTFPPVPLGTPVPIRVHSHLLYNPTEPKLPVLQWDITQLPEHAKVLTGKALWMKPYFKEPAVVSGPAAVEHKIDKIWIESDNPTLGWWMRYHWGPLIVFKKEGKELTVFDVLEGIYQYLATPLTRWDYDQIVNMPSWSSLPPWSNLERLFHASERRRRDIGSLTIPGCLWEGQWKVDSKLLPPGSPYAGLVPQLSYNFRRSDVLGSQRKFIGMKSTVLGDGTWYLSLGLDSGSMIKV